MEQRLAGGELPVTGYRLFTGHRSLGNLRLYERLGYRRTQVEEVSTKLSFIAMEKSVPVLAATA